MLRLRSFKRVKPYVLYGARIYRKREWYQDHLQLIKACFVLFPAVTIIGTAALANSESTSSIHVPSVAAGSDHSSDHTAADNTATNNSSADPTKTNTTSTAGTPTVAADTFILSDTVWPKPAWTKSPLYVDPANEATTYAQSNPQAPDAGLIAREGNVPVATWFGDWNADVRADVNAYTTAATGAGAVPVLVLYNIPQRDCGSYSAGGANSISEYVNWVRAAASGIGNRQAVVILEPDALAGLDCLSQSNQQDRYTALSQAVTILKDVSNVTLYLDAGNPAWQTAGTMANRLIAANIARADGFSLNVSNYRSTAQNQTYGDQISKLVDNKHYVIDTSRNGNGNLSPDAWCNAPGAALGGLPTAATGDTLNDAWLWVKIPWESDGTCNNGAPSAGQVYWAFAVQMARNAGW